jgi:hypothetical protein
MLNQALLFKSLGYVFFYEDCHVALTGALQASHTKAPWILKQLNFV